MWIPFLAISLSQHLIEISIWKSTWHFFPVTNFRVQARLDWYFRFTRLTDVVITFNLYVSLLFHILTLHLSRQVKVLRSMKVLDIDDVVVGQYKAHTRGGVKFPGYTDDSTVPNNSITPTFAAAAIFIDNARWDGVPFLMKAGKALHRKGWVLPQLKTLTRSAQTW